MRRASGALALGSLSPVRGSRPATTRRGEAARLAKAWSAVPPRSSRDSGSGRRRPGRCIAVEPESQVVGSPGRQQEDLDGWPTAPEVLRVRDSSPTGSRPTSCGARRAGADPRWSYFWHAGSPVTSATCTPGWTGSTGFAHLVGHEEPDVLLGGKALDLSACREVYGDAAGDRSCLYGEVTPPQGFDTWFCGDAGRRLPPRISWRRPARSPPDLADARGRVRARPVGPRAGARPSSRDPPGGGGVGPQGARSWLLDLRARAGRLGAIPQAEALREGRPQPTAGSPGAPIGRWSCGSPSPSRAASPTIST